MIDAMMCPMRTTVRVDDDLLEQLKARARAEKVSLARLLNRTLRAGLKAGGARAPKPRAYREQVRDLGVPRVALEKAVALADALEDEEIVRELGLRK